MMTSMATAKTLISERSGLWSRLAKMSLFIPGEAPSGASDAENQSFQG
jgi:hypothetical protein